jgi:hypothetical protein
LVQSCDCFSPGKLVTCSRMLSSAELNFRLSVAGATPTSHPDSPIPRPVINLSSLLNQPRASSVQASTCSHLNTDTIIYPRSTCMVRLVRVTRRTVYHPVFVLGHSLGKNVKVKRGSVPGILLPNKDQIQWRGASRAVRETCQ